MFCWLLLVWLIGKTTSVPLKGDNEQLGNQGIHHPIEQYAPFTYPSPTEFLEKYLKPKKPVLFRGVAKESPAFKEWTDKYMGAMAPPSPNGDVAVHSSKEEDPKEEARYMHIHEFLESYNNTNIKMVSEIPEWLEHDLIIPWPLQCDELMHGGFDSAGLWMSAGTTKTVLHNDQHENMICVMRGKQNVVLINSTQYKDQLKLFLPATENETFYNKLIDADHVDVRKYPIFWGVDYHVALVDSGDCLYIPEQWVQHTRAAGDHDLVISMFWRRNEHLNVDITNCQRTYKRAFTFEWILWVSDELIAMHKNKIKEFYNKIKEKTKHNAWTLHEFTDYLTESCEFVRTNSNALDYLKNIYHILDLNKNDILGKKDFPEMREMKKIETARLIRAAFKFDTQIFRHIRMDPLCHDGYILHNKLQDHEKKMQLQLPNIGVYRQVNFQHESDTTVF